MNVLSLFSGIGGLDLGLERAGMTVVGQVEIDPWCRSILAKHWPEVPRHDDVRTAAEWWQSTARSAVDLVCGGVPCQPVSVAGKGLVQADERWLWPATLDLVGELRPRFALLENVTGLLARGMGDVLGQLAEVGYDAEWDCVSASAVGAPHQRDRVWIIAYPVGDGLRQQPVAEPRSGRAAVAEHDGTHRDVADAEVNGRREGRPGRLALAGQARQGFPPQELADAGSERRGEGSRQLGRLGTQGCGQELADTASQRRSGRIFARPHVVNHRSQPAHGDAGTWRDRDWWLAEPDVGRVAHGISARVDRLRGLGNAVVPQVAEHIGRLIMEAAA